MSTNNTTLITSKPTRKEWVWIAIIALIGVASMFGVMSYEPPTPVVALDSGPVAPDPVAPDPVALPAPHFERSEYELVTYEASHCPVLVLGSDKPYLSQCDDGDGPAEAEAVPTTTPAPVVTVTSTPDPTSTPVVTTTPVPTTTPDKPDKVKTNNGNHYGNDRQPDNNPKDVKNKHDGCDSGCTGNDKGKEDKPKKDK